LVPGPVEVQVALAPQPPLFVSQLFTALHACPVPWYPELQVQVLVPGPVELQVAFASQPPLFVVHESTILHTVPFPE
jgi:hypothetical protein